MKLQLRKLIPGIALFMAFLIISLPICFATELSLTYDANGNLVTGDGKYRVYNSLNQLYRVYNGSNSSGTLLYELKYHPIEERVLVKKSYNNSGALVETVYYWSQNFITVVNASGSFNYTYIYHNGDLVAQQNPDGSKLFVLGDNKGSTSVITNGSGAVLERTTYSPSGEVLSGGRLNRYGYESKEQELGFGKVPTNGLVSYYASEGGAFDDGIGNQGIVVNATLIAGKVRDGYSFNGNGSYIAINDSGSLDLTNGITISAWVYPVENQQGYVVSKYGAYMIQYRGSGGSNDTQGGIWIGGSWTALATSSAIPLNTWTQVVFTYNKSKAYIYINGVQSGSGNSTSNIDTNYQMLCIGAKNSTDRTRDFNGSIDEVGIWNMALNAAEVAQLYQYGGSFDSGFRSTDFNARRYNQNTALFDQPDTLIPNVFDPQSLNRYMFERGNPYRNKDETGHMLAIAPLLMFAAVILYIALPFLKSIGEEQKGNYEKAKEIQEKGLIKLTIGFITAPVFGDVKGFISGEIGGEIERDGQPNNMNYNNIYSGAAMKYYVNSDLKKYGSYLEMLLLNQQNQQQKSDLSTNDKDLSGGKKSGDGGSKGTPGSYSSKAGGYLTTAGKFYPTTNPNFVPGVLKSTNQ